jgi:hypothetical protein
LTQNRYSLVRRICVCSSTGCPRIPTHRSVWTTASGVPFRPGHGTLQLSPVHQPCQCCLDQQWRRNQVRICAHKCRDRHIPHVSTGVLCGDQQAQRACTLCRRASQAGVSAGASRARNRDRLRASFQCARVPIWADDYCFLYMYRVYTVCIPSSAVQSIDGVPYIGGTCTTITTLPGTNCNISANSHSIHDKPKRRRLIMTRASVPARARAHTQGASSSLSPSRVTSATAPASSNGPAPQPGDAARLRSPSRIPGRPAARQSSR